MINTSWHEFFNKILFKMQQMNLGGVNFYAIIEDISFKESGNMIDPSLTLTMKLKLWPDSKLPEEYVRQIEDKRKGIEPALRAIEDKQKLAEPKEEEILDVEVA